MAPFEDEADEEHLNRNCFHVHDELNDSLLRAENIVMELSREQSKSPKEIHQTENDFLLNFIWCESHCSLLMSSLRQTC
jgi:hypothetical protein